MEKNELPRPAPKIGFVRISGWPGMLPGFVNRSADVPALEVSEGVFVWSVEGEVIESAFDFDEYLRFDERKRLLDAIGLAAGRAGLWTTIHEQLALVAWFVEREVCYCEREAIEEFVPIVVAAHREIVRQIGEAADEVRRLLS